MKGEAPPGGIWGLGSPSEAGKKRTLTFVALVIKELRTKPRNRVTGNLGRAPSVAAQAQRWGLVEPLT